jgi:hypothetical protein
LQRWQGPDRVFVGVDRMAVDGWTAQQAYDEARTFGVSASKLDYFDHVADLLDSGALAHYEPVR